MINSIKRHPVLTLLLLFLAVPAGLNYSGFCIAQGRYLSDEEKVKLVIQNVINEHSEYIYDFPSKDNTKRKNPALKYNNITDFIEHNPDCCQIGGSNNGNGYWNPFSIWDHIFGLGGDIASVSYKEILPGSNTSRNIKIISKQYAITNCGKIW